MEVHFLSLAVAGVEGWGFCNIREDDLRVLGFPHPLLCIIHNTYVVQIQIRFEKCLRLEEEAKECERVASSWNSHVVIISKQSYFGL